MVEKRNVVVIGAGQAGLSVGYYLTRASQDYLILEKSKVLTPTWRGRWDSFTLVLPNWTAQMPGFPYQGDSPDDFMGRDELVEYMERYAETINPEIRFGTTVNSVEAKGDGGGFLVRTGDDVIETNHVVIATGTFQEPKIPPLRANIASEITQLHTNDYRNPQDLPEGAVLVVGTGQSGCQIAEELYQNGRKVYLCVGSANPVPRRYRGRDMIWWLDEMGFFDQTADTLPSSKARFLANPYVSGKDGGHTLDLHQFARDGVTLLGHLDDAQGNQLTVAADLHENLAKGDQFIASIKETIDKIIEEKDIEVEVDSSGPALQDGYDAGLIEELDLNAEGIRTIIWATGYRFDYSWIKLPVLDQDDYPIQELGVADFAGLYFVGLHWTSTRKSGLLWGVGEIAENVAGTIASRSQQSGPK